MTEQKNKEPFALTKEKLDVLGVVDTFIKNNEIQKIRVSSVGRWQLSPLSILCLENVCFSIGDEKIGVVEQMLIHVPSLIRGLKVEEKTNVN